MDIDMQYWPIDVQHRNGNAALTWTYSIDIDIQHRHGYAVLTYCIDVKHRNRNAVLTLTWTSNKDLETQHLKVIARTILDGLWMNFSNKYFSLYQWLVQNTTGSISRNRNFAKVNFLQNQNFATFREISENLAKSEIWNLAKFPYAEFRWPH
jgi:hypothetical protein